MRRPSVKRLRPRERRAAVATATAAAVLELSSVVVSRDDGEGELDGEAARTARLLQLADL